MPLSEAQMVEAIRRYQAGLASLVELAEVIALIGFAALDAYNTSDVGHYQATTEPKLAVVKSRTVALAVAFYTLTATARQPSVRAADVPVGMAWRDPFIAYWRALKQGERWDDAVLSGMSRAEAAGSNLVVSSARRTGDHIPSQNIVGWRRVLSKPSCPWCQRVSTQRYRTAESADFGHHRCDCTVAPIYGDADPGRVINKPLLAELKRTGAADKLDAAVQQRRARAIREQIAGAPPEARRKLEDRVAAYEANAARLRQQGRAKAATPDTGVTTDA